MRQFETLLLFSPELSAENREGLISGLVAIIEREGGNMDEIDQWGMRDLAYPVRKQMRGFYVRLVYSGPGAIVAELERNLRITEGIYKFLTVKLDKKADQTVEQQAEEVV